MFGNTNSAIVTRAAIVAKEVTDVTINSPFKVRNINRQSTGTKVTAYNEPKRRGEIGMARTKNTIEIVNKIEIAFVY